MATTKLHGQPNDLHRAIQRGDLAAVRTWIAAGRSLEDRDETATSPLALAAFFNKPAIFQELLQAGAVTQPTDDGNHLLFYAAWRNNRKMVETLLAKKLDVNFQCKGGGSSGQTALMGAVKGGHRKLVELLIAHGADLSLTDNKGHTALDYADENGQEELITYLRAKKAPGKVAAQKKPSRPHPGEKAVAKAQKVLAKFPALAIRPRYQKFLARLTALLGRKPKAYTNPDACEYGKLKGVYTFTLLPKHFTAEPDLLTSLRQEAARAGGLLVEADAGQDPLKGITCLLFPTTDKAAVLLAQETSSNGIVGADTEDLVAFLQDLDQANPFTLTVCNGSTLAGEFAGPVKRAMTFARRMLDLCPDEEGDSEAKEIAASLQRERAFFLWWD